MFVTPRLTIVEHSLAWRVLINEVKSLPSPLRAPTLPRTCSAHRCASSFFCISFTAASACFIAADAVAKMPPHQPPPLLCCSACGCGCGDSAADAPSDGVASAGVILVWNGRVLSPDLRDVDLSSLDLSAGGVAVEVRLVPGVAGRLAGLWTARSSSSLRTSCPSSLLLPWGLDAGWFEVTSTFKSSN